MNEKDRKNTYQNIYSGCLWVLGIQVILLCLYILIFFSKQVLFYKKEENQSLESVSEIWAMFNVIVRLQCTISDYM